MSTRGFTEHHSEVLRLHKRGFTPRMIGEHLWNRHYFGQPAYNTSVETRIRGWLLRNGITPRTEPLPGAKVLPRLGETMPRWRAPQPLPQEELRARAWAEGMRRGA